MSEFQLKLEEMEDIGLHWIVHSNIAVLLLVPFVNSIRLFVFVLLMAHGVQMIASCWNTQQVFRTALFFTHKRIISIFGHRSLHY